MLTGRLCLPVRIVKYLYSDLENKIQESHASKVALMSLEMEKTKKLYEYKLKSFQDNFENEIKILKDATDVMKNSLELKTKEVVAVKEKEVKPQKEVATYSEISRDLDDKVKAHVEEMNIIKQDLDDQELSCKEKDGRISELEGKLAHVEMDYNIVKGEQESELLKHQQLKANLSKSNNLNE